MAEPAEIINIDRGKRQMPSKNGYISLWRDVNEQPWAEDELMWSVFTKLLIKVQSKPYVTSFKNTIDVPLQAGELASTYQDISNLFTGIKDKRQARVIVERFKRLGQLYTREIKKGAVNIGVIIGFSGWKKWQNNPDLLRTPPRTPLRTPEASNIKSYSDTHAHPYAHNLAPLNNNDLNNNKKSMPSSEGEQPEKESFTKERSEAFDHFWSEWGKCKKLVSVKDNSKKKPARDRFMNSIFPVTKVKSLGVDAFFEEVDQLVSLAWLEHEALYQDQQRGGRYFHPIQNTHAASFLKHEGWRD